jgi:3'(2'), 5'-bisphosphate nucleotidase
MNLNADQLQALCDIADAAGREVMAVYSGDITAWTKDDQTPLTEADLRADRVIRDGLTVAFPGVPIVSEEGSDHLLCKWSDPNSPEKGSDHLEDFFLVDPLDGTKEFLKRNGEFTVNIALIAKGNPVAGVVLAPALNEMFYAAQGLGAWKRDVQGTHALQPAAWKDGQVLRIIGSRSHGSAEMEQWLARLRMAHTFIAAGSSLKFCRLAEGKADLYPRLGPTSQWDTAAGQAVLELAGGEVVEMSGPPLRYGQDRPILNPFFIAVGDRRLLPLVKSL